MSFTPVNARQLLASVTTDSTTTGSAATIQNTYINNGIVRLTNSSLSSISGIPASSSGYFLTIENQTGNTININNNDSGASSGNRIFTGTGTTISMSSNSTFEFVYDGTVNQWMFIGGIGSGGSGGSKNYLSPYIASTSGGVANIGNGNFELGSTTGWSLAFSALGGSPNYPATVTTPGIPYLNDYYIFTVSSANATTGATYTNNSQTFTVVGTISAGTNLVTTGTGAPSSGTLTKTSGTGDSTITFSAFQSTAAISPQTFTAVTASPLAGSYSGNWASTSSITAGSMVISSPFYIDLEDQAKMMQIKLYYKVTTGVNHFNFSGTSSNTLAIWVYDVTNALWIQPAGVYNFVQSSGVGYCTGTFQTTSNSTQYQLCLFANTGTGAFSNVALYVDDFFLGPQIAPSGPAMTDWITYTPTFNGLGTVTSINFFSRRVGDTLQVQGKFVTGTTTASLATVSLGFDGVSGNVSLDTTKVGDQTLIGHMSSTATGSTEFTWEVIANGTTPTTVYITDQTSTTAGLSPGNGNVLFGSTTPYSFFCQVPIVGWSSNTAMSNDTDTRVVAMQAGMASGTSVTGSSNIVWDTVINDTHAAYSTSTGIYTVPISGFYKVVSAILPGTGNSLSVFQNGSLAYRLGQDNSIPTITTNVAGTATLRCVAGDQISIQYGTSSSITSGTPYNYFMVERLSGPAIITATETVAFAGSGATSSAAGSNVTVPLATIEQDTHNQWNSTNNNWTAPVSGTYNISGQIVINTTSTASINQYSGVQILINGTNMRSNYNYVQSTGIQFWFASVSYQVHLLAGSTIALVADTTVTSPVLSTNITNTFLQIVRTGN